MNRIDWHRMFGLLLSNFFSGSPFEVELEKDLSIKKQLLDVIILRRRPGRFVGRLPDGLDNLATYNLITFKSFRELLNDWALKELTGHYVNYRKQVSPSFEKLLPEEEFRLYAVCSRYPRELAASPGWNALSEGVYEYRRGTDSIRVIVLQQLPDEEQNAVLHLLSASPDKVRYGAEHYQRRSTQTSTLIDQLFQDYQLEGVPMPYTMEDFNREYRESVFKKATVEERLEGLTPEQVVNVFTPEKLLSGMSPTQIERYLKKIKTQPTPRKPKKKK